ncbi:MAG: 5-methyltetrahydropteroyltriglutamate--homocysteine S-methyltransferase [Rhodospirillales bacterium]|nr:5-methyltetrahydropteroyltriglutamate--homocysteine S-methyltransferase [Rhodospirillales bacterium]
MAVGQWYNFYEFGYHLGNVGLSNLRNLIQGKERDMASNDHPPFRADIVGSLLRPHELKDARGSHERGEITAADLRTVEDKFIRDAVAMQEEVGLQAVTDGEFRRRQFHMDFLSGIDGIEVEGEITVRFRNEHGETEYRPRNLVVADKLRHPQGGIQVEDFKFLKSVTSRAPKVCIPGPGYIYARGGWAAIEKTYEDKETFFADVAQVYCEELAMLSEAGCTYVQIDDTNFSHACDAKFQDRYRNLGEDPDEIPHIFARMIADVVRGRPDGMTICLHLCHGNFRSSWASEGGYEHVADAVFRETGIDAFFLEFDTPKSGDFAPLRYVPEDKTVVLGLVTTKHPELEPKNDLKRRIEEASRYVPLDYLALSPQCGFASTIEGNELTEDNQIRKLRLVVEVAKEVWS